MKKLGCLAFAAMLGLMVVGCASSPEKDAAKARAAALEALKPVMTDPEKEPDWVNSVPITNKQLAFVGVSNKFATESEARSNAQSDGRNQLVKYYGTLISDRGRTATASYGITSDVFNPQIASQELEEFMAEGLAKGLPAKEFYTETYVTTSSKYAYKVYVLMIIDKAEADKALKDYCSQKAVEYQKQAEAEKDAEKRKQLEKVSEFFGGSLPSSMF